MLKIDFSKCTGCSMCVSACPANIYRMKDGKPFISDEKPCIKCMHCAAACPQNAISLTGHKSTLDYKPDKLPENFQKLLEDYLLTRRSYRHFKPEPISKETINDALRISAWAPSAKNEHPVKWIVINDDGIINKIMNHILEYVRKTGIFPEIVRIYESGHNAVMGNAKTIILSYAESGATKPYADSVLALYNAELILQSQGIGTCWSGYLMDMCNQVPAIIDLLKLPEGCQVYGALLAGYPEGEKYVHIPNRLKQPDVLWLSAGKYSC